MNDDMPEVNGSLAPRPVLLLSVACMKEWLAPFSVASMKMVQA